MFAIVSCFKKNHYIFIQKQMPSKLRYYIDTVQFSSFNFKIPLQYNFNKSFTKLIQYSSTKQVQYKTKEGFACREFLIGGALLIVKLIEERAPPYLKIESFMFGKKSVHRISLQKVIT